MGAPQPAVALALLRCRDADDFTLVGDSPLSEWERFTSSRIAHVRRRAEWTAGRLAAKWLLLECGKPEAGEGSTVRFVWPPPVYAIGPHELGIIPPSRYRQVEVRRDDDGAPRLAGAGGVAIGGGVHASIAHCGGWAVAALSRVGPLGVDIEQVAPRRPGFYETNLSDRERRWMLGAAGVDLNRVGTLLWVLKEAFLKTGRSAARTVWGISLTDLDITTPARHIAAAWGASDATFASHVPPELVALSVHMPLAAGSAMSAHIAYGAISNLAIGVVALEPSDTGVSHPEACPRGMSGGAFATTEAAATKRA